MKKLLLTALAVSFLPLFAAVDATKSYFTVSTHQPGVNTPVEIRIFLRDADRTFFLLIIGHFSVPSFFAFCLFYPAGSRL